PVVLAATLSDSGPPQTFPAKAGIVLLGDPPQRFLARYGTVAENLPALTQAASGVGAINWIPDRDQVVRRVPLFFRQRDNIAPALAMEALRVAERQSTYMIRSSNASGQSAIGRASGVNLVRVGRYAIPTDADSGLWIRFRRSDPGAYIPAWRVLEGRLGPQDVHGAIVLVGTSAAGLLDLRATPLDPAIPGVEVHQQLLEQIMSGHYLTRPDYAPALELLLAALGIIVFAVLAPRLSATPTAGLGVGLIGFVFALGLWSYLGAGLLIDPLYPSLAIFIFAVASTFYLYRQTERQRSEIRRAFGQYVSPAVIHQLIANPDRLTLGGEVRELSLLFCDVRNFTSISERMNAAELTSFINSLLTPLTDIVLEQRGTIDKYMGDAIMAFWNAPIDDPDHAAHACAAAKAIIFKMKDLNTIWRAQAEAAGRPYAEVMIGVGINSGDCCVGNLGSQRRFDYSAIGDNVNVTARFEGLTKIYDLPVIVGEDTIRHLDDMEFMEVDLVRVKGRSAPLRIFTIVSALTLETKSGAAFAGAHMAFLKAMRAKRWDDAAARLEQARALGGASMHTLYALFDRRLAYLKDHAPADWDGVYNVETKD
ncbi:MAG: CHASE2 domain-containing protein, partial [Hyphomonadaceae bacterium]